MDRVMERFERIYEEHAPAVRAYVRRRAPESIVEDVLADVFVVCLRRIDDVPRNALPWLYGVARKTLANERRKRRDLPIAAPELAYEPEPVGDLQLATSNEGTGVPTSSVLPGQAQLDQALQDMQVGDTMQLLGTVNGVRIYAARNAAGHICLAIDHVAETYEKGVFCDLNDPGFPSPNDKVLSFPGELQGIAADGVATVAFVDADGTVLDSAPVTDNVFASSMRIGLGV